METTARWEFMPKPDSRCPLAAWSAAVLAAAALGLCSCGGPDRVEVSPVRGKVLFRGQPVPYAWVVFYPQGGSEEVQRMRPSGRAGPDGSFTLTSYDEGDGAPAGQYKVTVEWPSEDPNDPSNPDDPETRVPRGPDRFGGRYADPATTPLTATVKEGDNDLEPLRLP
jgi:hypothetical protein